MDNPTLLKGLSSGGKLWKVVMIRRRHEGLSFCLTTLSRAIHQQIVLKPIEYCKISAKINLTTNMEFIRSFKFSSK
jgi:hypothetical protein